MLGALDDLSLLLHFDDLIITVNKWVVLTHLSLASHKRDIGKQNAVSDQGLYCLH